MFPTYKKISFISKKLLLLKFAKRTFITIAILIIALYIIVPILWTFLISIKETSDIYSETFINKSLNTLTFYRYVEMWTGKSATFESTWQEWKLVVIESFKHSLLNSFLIGLGVAALSLFCGALAAYSFSKLKSKIKNSLFTFLVLLRFLPTLVIFVPIFSILRNINLINTKTGLILVYTALMLPLVIWILKSFFETIPNEILDAAMIDGASGFRILFLIIFPISLPAFVTAGLMSFVISWQEFLLALVITSSNNSKTIPVAMAEFYGKEGLDLGMLATGTILAILPIVVVAFIAQRFIIKGLITGAVVE